MACGVPVISSNTGGLPEVNIEGVSGFLSDVGNVSEMAENAITILASDEILAKFKKQAIEAAMVYDTQKIVPQYEKLYEAAIAKKSSASCL
jgi:glycosyltransferase involved in cell wall biosynthesis